MNQVIKSILILTIALSTLTGSVIKAEPAILNDFISDKPIAGINVTLETSDLDTVDKYFTDMYYIKGIPLDKKLQKYIYKLCSIKGIEYELILACIEKESGYENKISKDGHDYGLMQIRDINHEYLNGIIDKELNYMNEYDNVLAGITMLSNLIEKYPSYNIHCILMSYNYGETGAKRLFNQGIYSSVNSRKTVKIYEEIKSLKGEYEYK